MNKNIQGDFQIYISVHLTVDDDENPDTWLFY